MQMPARRDVTEDLRYEPSTSGYDWLIALQPIACLVLGAPSDSERDILREVADEVRSVKHEPLTKALHDGTYAFEVNGVWRGLVVSAGRPSGASRTARSRYTEDGDLVVAGAVFERDWNDADPLAGRALFSRGDMVRPRSAGIVGRVKEIRPVAGTYRYDVDVQGEIRQYNEDSLVLVEGDPRDPAFWLTQEPVTASQLALTLTWTKLRNPLTDTLYSFGSSKTVFRAYQFKPVLKMLTGSSGRLLIADEVGLGKTIEAGLIWSELEQRRRLGRVLVVAPAVLTLKWQAEMERRFDRRLQQIKPKDLADFADSLERGDEPALHGVISLESLRGADEVLGRLAELQPRLDLVVVDEAHYLRNRESKSHALGRLLADWTDYLVFLSATPLNLGNDDLFNLMNLLEEGSFADRALFDAQLEPNRILNDVARSLLDEGRRHPRKLANKLAGLRALQFGSSVTDRADYRALRAMFEVDRPLGHEEVARARRMLAELNILGGVLTRTRKAEVPDTKAVREARTIDVTWTDEEHAYYHAVYGWYMSRALEMGTPPGFATQMPLRQAASCIPASQQLMLERHPQVFQDELDDFDEDSAVDLTALRRTPALAATIPVDSKYEQVLTELLQLRDLGLRQVMIFSFFRRTLGYLERRLSEHFSVRVMHGGVPMAAREAVMREFRAGAFEVLLLSEVGSEGLDFEFCNVLVNYDLPWNPMRVEQRIGRLDRFGQEHEKIFIYNVHVPGTIETDIFQRLYDRIGVFENSIGELEPILRSELADITKKLLDPKLNQQERRREIDRIAVAVQQRSAAIDELKAARAHLSGLDGLIVEGLTDQGPGNGRFIGTAEIIRLLDELFRRYPGSRTGGRESFGIVGTPQLAERLRSSRPGEGGSRYSLSKLAAILQNGEELACTVRPEIASRSEAELLSGRHPLIRLAMEVLEEESLSRPRFGAMAVPGLPPGRRYLVAFHLAATSGLRPLLELWATAIDMDSGAPEDSVGDRVLTALAEGNLSDGTRESPPELTRLWDIAQDRLARRHIEEERARRQDNAALVEGRIRAREASLDRQVEKTLELLRRLRAEGRKAQILRLHEARVRNLRSRRAEIRLELEANSELDISLTSIAVALIEAAEHTPSPYTSR